MSLEMAHKVILPPKKNYIPQFLKQRDINSYYIIQQDDKRKDMKKSLIYVKNTNKRLSFLVCSQFANNFASC
jgi:hypothetical protein